MAFVFPGQKVIPSSRLMPAQLDGLGDAGLYLKDDSYLHSSLFGKLSVISSDGNTEYKVLPPVAAYCHPKAQDIIIGKVTKISQKNVSVSLILREEKSDPKQYTRCAPGYSGIIRLHDIHDRILGEEANSGHVTISAFRPGDVVRLKVLAIAEKNTYYLSSASLDLGVLYGYNSMTGELMTPISEDEMICPTSNQVENRKIALMKKKEDSS